MLPLSKLSSVFAGRGLKIGLGLGIGMGVGTLAISSRLSNKLTQGTAMTNPIFGNPQPSGYGKRGIDANNNNTNGLVQSLHSSRRKF